MKQSIKGILCIAIALFAFSKIEAQVTFKPGIRAGVNLSHFSKGDGYTYYYDATIRTRSITMTVILAQRLVFMLVS
jgi:hypothetical protein